MLTVMFLLPCGRVIIHRFKAGFFFLSFLPLYRKKCMWCRCLQWTAQVANSWFCSLDLWALVQHSGISMSEGCIQFRAACKSSEFCLCFVLFKQIFIH